MKDKTMVSEEALRAMVAGALGDEMAKFPVRFCQPIHFGLPPSPGHPVAVSNGTATLLRVHGKPLIVTCAHVIEGYRRKMAEDKSCVFAVGDCYLNPLSQLIAEDPAVDASVVSLSHKQAEEITHGRHGIGEAFFELENAPAIVKIDDYVAFAGFPGDLRQVRSFSELDFGSYSSGACRVTDVHSDYLTCQFEREHWIVNFSEGDPASLGGLSGGPAFVIRHSPTGVQHYEFAGIVFRMHEESESLYVRGALALPLDW